VKKPALRVFIRVDASLKIGVGHVMRCLTLANTLKKNGADVSFICRDYPGHLQVFIQKQGFDVELLRQHQDGYAIHDGGSEYSGWLGVSWQQDAEETKKFLRLQSVDWLIIDHYGIDFRWHKCMRSHTKKIMVIDDLANRNLHCDLLLDQTYGREKNRYSALVHGKSELLLGTGYALIRPEFKKLRQKAIAKRNNRECVSRVLVSMGSMDPDNLTSLVLAGLGNVNWKENPIVDVVLGSKAPGLQSVINQAKKHSLIVNVLENVDNMPNLMLSADLAIGAGGTTSWERCSLGLPTLLVKLADNQTEVISVLVKAGTARRVFDIKNDLVKECNNFVHNPTLMSELSENAFKVADGQGAELTAIKILPDISRDGGQITIRNANMNDAEIIHKWQLNPLTRRHFLDPATPEYDKHLIWLDKVLAIPTDFFYIIEYDNEPAGVLRLSHKCNEINNYHLVSIYVSPDHYRLGLGATALGYCDRLFSGNELRAEILKKNIASKNLFLKCGYVKNSEHDLYIKNPQNRTVYL